MEVPFRARIWGTSGTVESYEEREDGLVDVAFRLRRRAGPIFIEEVQNYVLKPEEVVRPSLRGDFQSSRVTTKRGTGHGGRRIP